MNTKKLLFSVLLILVALCGCSGLGEELIRPGVKPEEEAPEPENPTPEASYTNPLLKNEEMVWDPAVVFDGTIYYLYSTEEAWADGTRPEIGIFKSIDMTNWEFVGQVTELGNAWNRGLDAFKFGDKFYIYAFSDHDGGPKVYVYESRRGDSGFTLKGSVTFPSSLVLNGDSFTNFIIDGDKQYATLKGAVNDGTNDIWGIYLIEMDGVMNFKEGTQPKLISNMGTFQNPTIIKNKDAYYLISKNESYWGPGVLKVVKSDAVTGPYTDSDGETAGNTMLEFSAGDKQINGISTMLTDKNGDSWIYYSVGVGGGARLYLDKVLWDGTAFPYIKDKLPSTTEQIVPILK